MRKLISMVEFVLEQHETETLDTSQIMWYDKEVEKLCKIRNYANFLKQPLAIWQFVPCKLVDGVWVVLEKQFYPTSMSFSEDADAHFKEYQEAKSRCIFEGFWLSAGDQKHGVYIVKNNPNTWDVKIGFKYKEGHETIEDLVKYNLELTASAIKELGL